MGVKGHSPKQVMSARELGCAAEEWACQYLQDQGLRLLWRNFRTPGRGGGEIDLVMQERDGTVVFVEVRRRLSGTHGGALASVGVQKQRRIVWAAKHFLNSWAQLPPCRFDVVAVQGNDADRHLQWLRAAFDADQASGRSGRST